MIGRLQGDFGDLDIKYLKQNISKCRSHILGSFRRTPWHCAKWLRNSPGKRYQHCAKWLRNSPGKSYRQIRICLTREVKTPSFPIRRQAPDVKYPEKVEHHPTRIPNVRYLEKMERLKGDHPRVHDVGTHPKQLHLDSPRGYTARFPIQTPSRRSTRHSRTSHTRMIAYPIRTRHSRSSHPDDSISYPDMALVIIIPYSLHSGFAYGKGLQSFGSSCF